MGEESKPESKPESKQTGVTLEDVWRVLEHQASSDPLLKAQMALATSTAANMVYQRRIAELEAREVIVKEADPSE